MCPARNLGESDPPILDTPQLLLHLDPHCYCYSYHHFYLGKHKFDPQKNHRAQTSNYKEREVRRYLGTNISLPETLLKMMFLFQRWDMLVPWRVSALTTHDSTNMAYAIPHCLLNLSDLARQTPGDSPQVLLLVISTRRAGELKKVPPPLTLPETNVNVAPENWWLQDEFPFGMANFQGLY